VAVGWMAWELRGLKLGNDRCWSHRGGSSGLGMLKVCGCFLKSWVCNGSVTIADPSVFGRNNVFKVRRY
jgi:hypothetical protein